MEKTTNQTTYQSDEIFSDEKIAIINRYMKLKSRHKRTPKKKPNKNHHRSHDVGNVKWMFEVLIGLLSISWIVFLLDHIL